MHPTLLKISFPFAILCLEDLISGPIVIILGASENCGAKVFTYWTTERISCSFKMLDQAGIPVPGSPLVTTFTRSSSTGTLPWAVVLYLKRPLVKSLGRGAIQ